MLIMDQDTKDGIIGIFILIIIIIVTSFFIYAVFIHEPSEDPWLEPKNHYTYYIDMDSHSKLNEYLINDIDVRESFKAWSDLNDISFTEVDEPSDDYKMAWIHRKLGIEPQLPDIIIFFSQTPSTYGVVGETRCYITYCIIEIIMGHHDCNNDYRLYDYNFTLHTLKHEIGHNIGVFHTNDEESIMYSKGNKIGHNKAIDDFNPRNLTIPDHKYLSEFKDYGYVINQAQQRVYTEGTVDIPKIIRCFNTPPFLSYDWFSFEIRKIYHTLYFLEIHG